jgi:hypothetical protein
LLFDVADAILANVPLGPVFVFIKDADKDDHPWRFRACSLDAINLVLLKITNAQVTSESQFDHVH